MEKPKRLSKHEINQNIHDHMNEITKEFRDGFEEIKKYTKSVTIFGSSHATPSSPHYREAQELSYKIVKELGYTVVTGGGPGIMAAANLGAQEARGNSIGLIIDLPDGQHINPYTTSSAHFKYFFTRKTMLTFSSEAFVFFPGGYGTFDELFSVMTLIQTKKIPRIPIILIGIDFWKALKDFMSVQMMEKHGAINHHDLELFVITDDMNKAVDIIRKAQVSNWWETED